MSSLDELNRGQYKFEAQCDSRRGIQCQIEQSLLQPASFPYQAETSLTEEIVVVEQEVHERPFERSSKCRSRRLVMSRAWRLAATAEAAEVLTAE